MKNKITYSQGNIYIRVGPNTHALIEKPEIQKAWIASTGHITKKDSELLDNENELPYANQFYGGWRVLADNADENFIKELRDLGFSEHFCLLLAITKEMGCCWLELDRDGPLYDKALPVFEW